MRAVVDNPALLQLNGGRPERLAAFSRPLGGALAAWLASSITPISGGTLDVHVLTLLVLDSIAAAMFGRLRSIWLTFAERLVLGLASTYVLGYFPESWSWASNFRIALPMIVLFVVLIVLPQDRLRGATLLRTRERFTVPTMRSAVTWGVILLVVVLLPRTGDGHERHGVADRRHHLRHHCVVPDPAHGLRRRDQPRPGSPSEPSPPSSCSTWACQGPAPPNGSRSGGLLLGMAVTAVVGGLIALPASACVASIWPWPRWRSASSSPT